MLEKTKLSFISKATHLILLRKIICIYGENRSTQIHCVRKPSFLTSQCVVLVVTVEFLNLWVSHSGEYKYCNILGYDDVYCSELDTSSSKKYSYKMTRNYIFRKRRILRLELKVYVEFAPGKWISHRIFQHEYCKHLRLWHCVLKIVHLHLSYSTPVFQNSCLFLQLTQFFPSKSIPWNTTNGLNKELSSLFNCWV